MSNVNDAVKQLITEILRSDTYQEYDSQRKRVGKVPGLKEKIDEYRRRNYELQNRSGFAFDKIDQFAKEHENFRQDPMVSDFLEAELAFCRMMQRINVDITAALDFD
ncbi:MAG: YlbF family regulator [Candidatus Gastranaerophilales bacterium]|nr:YlbF family regulator [Candidatus Gastranaerophilales bacterium]